MKVTMDRVGRIVIPKGLRDQLGLCDGVAVLRSITDATLTDRMVRELRDADQR